MGRSVTWCMEVDKGLKVEEDGVKVYPRPELHSTTYTVRQLLLLLMTRPDPLKVVEQVCRDTNVPFSPLNRDRL